MEYVIGIDGGGTKTSLIIADLQGNKLIECKGGPSNINSVAEEVVYHELKRLILTGIKKINGDAANCKAICLGTAGSGTQHNRTILESMLKSIACNSEIIVTDDIQTVLYSEVRSGEGIVMISGTGSICYGRNKEGQTCRVGGWGHIIGDEGSGYEIGRRMLLHIMRSYDGREANTLLTSLVLKHLNLRDIEELITYVYRDSSGKKEIADLAALVDSAVALGDVTAIKILDNAVEELFAHVETCINKLSLNSAKVKLIIGGSILLRCDYIRNKISNLIEKEYPLVEISKIKNNAAWGAVHIAINSIK